MFNSCERKYWDNLTLSNQIHNLFKRWNPQTTEYSRLSETLKTFKVICCKLFSNLPPSTKNTSGKKLVKVILICLADSPYIQLISSLKCPLTKQCFNWMSRPSSSSLSTLVLAHKIFFKHTVYYSTCLMTVNGLLIDMFELFSFGVYKRSGWLIWVRTDLGI